MPNERPPLLSQEQLDLQQFDLARANERFESGEDFQFGPGYKSCIEDYFSDELGDVIPNNLLLDDLFVIKGLPRDRIVPALAGSFEPNEYLSDIVRLEKVIKITNDLEVAVCLTPEDAKKLRQFAPIILPKSITRQARFQIQHDGTSTSDEKFPDGRALKDQFRSILANFLEAPSEQLAIHLGADEIIKAIYRAAEKNAAAENRTPSVFIPLPNYFDALTFAAQTNHRIFISDSFTDAAKHWKEWLKIVRQTKSDTLYLSQPNNPLGTKLSDEELEQLIQNLPENCHLIIDEVNLDLEKSHQIMSTDWPRIFKKYPNKKITIVDSFSKSHNLVPERIGFSLSSTVDLAREIRSYEPPRLSQQAILNIISTLGRPMERWSLTAVRHFHEKLNNIAAAHPTDITVSCSDSNFVTVFFQSLNARELFLKYAAVIDPHSIGAKKILGLPISGSGDFTPEDFNQDRSLSQQGLSRKGILGLPNTAIRLSALSHTAILDSLEAALSSY